MNKTTIYQWAKDYPEYSNALRRGQELSEAFWEDELVNMMRDRDVNAPLVKLYFANRFGWSDKQQTEHSGEMRVTEVRRTIIDPKDERP